MSGGTTVYLPNDVVGFVDKVKRDRMDVTRADTIRFLLLRALASMSYLDEDTKKALGIQRKESEL